MYIYSNVYQMSKPRPIKPRAYVLFSEVSLSRLLKIIGLFCKRAL